MKKTLNIICSIALIALAFNIASAQDNSNFKKVRDYLDKMFENLDKSKVPTGFLYDYAVNTVELEEYDGMKLNDNNYVDLFTWMDIMKSLRSSCVKDLNIKDEAEIISENSTDSDMSTNVVLLAYKYNFISEDALSANKIVYEGGKVYDVYHDGEWVNPYGERYLLAFAPLNATCHVGTYTFKFPSSAIFTNSSFSFMFDAGDGSGYHEQDSSGEFIVSYKESGIHVLKIRIICNDGQVLEAHSIINVVLPDNELQDENKQVFYVPDAVHEIYAGDVSAKLSIHYAPGRNTIERPYIVVEGFDPLFLSKNYSSNKESLQIVNNKRENGFTNYHQFFRSAPTSFEFFKENYDIIYVDWKNSEAPIERNGALLESIINWVNDNKIGNEKNIIVGYSMGGLIARYALTEMESNGKKHETAIYISYDSPHLGVNVPLGLQYLLNYVYRFLSGTDAVSRFTITKLVGIISGNKDILLSIYDLLYANCTSATQMMMKRVDENGKLDDLHYRRLKETLLNHGFPKGDDNDIINIGVSNGFSKPYFDENDRILDVNFTASTGLLEDALSLGHMGLNIILSWISQSKGLFLLPGKSSISVNAKAKAFTAPLKIISEAEVCFQKKLLWISSPIELSIFKASNTAPSGLHYDSILGSYYKYISTMKELGNEFIGTINPNIEGLNAFPFVPTVSALCIGGGEKEFTNADYTSLIYYNGENIEDSPFDYCIVPPEQKKKTTVHEHIAEYWGVYDLLKDVVGCEIIGPASPIKGSKYTVSNINDATSVYWHSNKEWLSFLPDGSVYVDDSAANGKATITATWYKSGQKIQKTKDVYAGFPDFNVFTISNTIIDNSVIVQANAVDTTYYHYKTDYLSHYEWGVKLGVGGTIRWYDSDKESITVRSPNYEPAWIYFRAISPNYTSKTYNVYHQFFKSNLKPRPLGNSSNYLRILVKEDNSICVIDDLGQEQNNISEQILSSPVVVESIESVIENREEILSTEIKLDGNNDNTHIVIMSASGI